MALLVQLREGEAKADPQSQSAFTKLPLEIRSEIYDYVYPEHVLHVKQRFADRAKGPLFSAFWYASRFTHPQQF